MKTLKTIGLVIAGLISAIVAGYMLIGGIIAMLKYG